MENVSSNKLSMPKFNTGHRTLQYLIIKEATNRRLLFFGTDVLKNTSISPPNIARKHFSLSKSGHCSKLVFPERLRVERIDGTTVNISEAFFYDIKGLLHVAFNFYDFNEQVSIIKYLYMEWSAMDASDCLPQFMEIDMCYILIHTFEPVVLGENKHDNCVEKQQRKCKLPTKDGGGDHFLSNEENQNSVSNYKLPTPITLEGTDSKNSSNISSKSCVVASCRRKKQTLDKLSKSTQIFSKFSQKTVKLSKSTQTLDRDTLVDIESKDVQTQTSKDTDKLLVKSMETQTESDQNKKRKMHPPRTVGSNNHHQSSINLLESMSNLLKDYVSEYLDDIFFFKVYSVVEAFLFLLKDELALVISTTTGIFPFHLLLEYAHIKKSNTPKNLHSNSNIYYQDGLLNLFSKWLGMQFCSFRSTISNQIAQYKKLLIQSNQFLPPALKVLNNEKLFPLCMVVFLNHWLNKRLEDEQFQYSKILLVLELMNDELLTGVGHVVYAKLKNIQSM